LYTVDNIRSTVIIPDDREVLHSIWAQSTGPHVFMPHMYDGVWHEGKPMAPYLDRLNYSVGERYFTPLRFRGSRRRVAVGRPGVIFADLDDDYGVSSLEPSVLIASSPGHYHAYWYLWETHDPDDWEPRAKGHSLELNADPGGWDLTQVLRVPGTDNHKREHPFRVRTILWHPERGYKLSDFSHTEILPPTPSDVVPTPDWAVRNSLVATALTAKRLPLGARYWLTVSAEDLKALGTIDRSRIMWQLERQLFEAGYTADEVFHLMWYAGVNKWRTPAELWREVKKAASVGV
jgi:hypothetical protein